MSRIAGCTALVTGAASGIGYLTGKLLLELGAAHLVIWEVQADAMKGVVGELSALGYRVDGLEVDVSDLAQVRSAVREMRARGIAVDLLVNNAGVVVGKEFAALSHEEIHRTMATNALAPMHVTLELLPEMLERRRGHIINVSSAAGMISNPRMSVYCASKWAMTGWSDALRIEMERSRTGIRVTTVMPYFIDTGMFTGVRSNVLSILKPDRVARAIVRAIHEDRLHVRLPWVLNLLPLARGLLPARWFDRIIGEGAGVYTSMSTFTGRAAASRT